MYHVIHTAVLKHYMIKEGFTVSIGLTLDQFKKIEGGYGD